MNRALPTIKENAEELQRLLKKEPNPKRKQRLQALFLIQSDQARSRSAIARLLIVHRHTVAAWLKLYEQGGLDGLLTIEPPTGKKSSLSDEALMELQERLSDPKGFASYGEIHSFLKERHQIKVGYFAVYKLVRYQLKAKPKSPRRSHLKKNRKQ